MAKTAHQISKREKKKIQQRKNKPVLFLILNSFIILILPVFYLSNALDYAMMPRLFLLGLFLLLFVPGVLSQKSPPYDYSILRDKFFWVYLGYFIITAVSLVFAVNYKEGFPDVFKTFAVLTLTATIAIVFSNTEDFDSVLPKFVVVAAFISFAVGMAQYIDKVIMATSPLLPDGREVIYEVKGMMAHKNQYAISLMLMLPFLGYGIYRYKKGWKWACITAFILLTGMILLLQTRSVWLGLIISTVVTVFLIARYPKKFSVTTKTRNFIAGTTVIVLITGLIVINEMGKKNPYSFTGRLRSIASPHSGNNVFRLKIWHFTTMMIADHPLTGVGAGNWKLHSAEYYNKYNLTFEKNQLNWLRPHNDYLWVFAEKGIVGLLLYLAMFGILLVYVFKILLSHQKKEHRIFGLFLLSGLICYLTVSFFTFPLERINQQAYLALISGIILSLNHAGRETKKPVKNRKGILYPTMIMLAMVTIYGYSMVAFESQVRKTRNAMGSQRWNLMLKYAKAIPTTFRTLDSEAVPVKSYEAQAYSKLKRLEESRDAYLEALKAHPTKINVMNNLGKVYYEIGNYKAAEQMFLKALEILPDYNESLINLSTTYYKTGKYWKTLKTLERIPPEKRDKTVKNNIRAIKKLIRKKKQEQKQAAN